MHNERLFHLMLCAIKKDKLDELDFVKQWAKMKDRRMEILWNN